MLCKITPDSSGLPRYEDHSKFLRIHPITHPMVTPKYLLAPVLVVLCLLSPSSCAGLELLTDGSLGGPGPPPSGSLSVSFIDVGQGDAVLVQAGGESYLIDGRPEEGPNVVDFLRSRSIDSLDGIVVTNHRS